MSITSEIKSAIDRSVSHNEIVTITIEGDSGDAMAVIRELVECGVDYAMCDYEGIDTMDVWGYEDTAKEGEMLWRLTIRFS